jgi:hypothetical protein
MATSGSYVYNDNRNEIIKDAYAKAGILDPVETPTAEQITTASRALNRMIKSWHALGYKVWAFSEVIVFPVQGRMTYTLGASGDRACFKSDFSETTAGEAIESNETVITLDDASDFAIGDNIGFQNGSVLIWRTIIAKSSNDVTISSSLGVTLDSGVIVYGYTNNIVKPMSIQTMRTQCGSGVSSGEYNCVKVGYTDYQMLTTKSSQGIPSQFAYMPNISDGTLYVYPTSADETQYYALSIQRPIQDFVSASDNPDFPIEWHRAIVYNLAKDLAVDFGIPTETYNRISVEADSALGAVMSFDNEDAPTDFSVDLSYYTEW